MVVGDHFVDISLWSTAHHCVPAGSIIVVHDCFFGEPATLVINGSETSWVAAKTRRGTATSGSMPPMGGMSVIVPPIHSSFPGWVGGGGGRGF